MKVKPLVAIAKCGQRFTASPSRLPDYQSGSALIRFVCNVLYVFVFSLICRVFKALAGTIQIKAGFLPFSVVPVLIPAPTRFVEVAEIEYTSIKVLKKVFCLV
jgi:hypothetical protein